MKKLLLSFLLLPALLVIVVLFEIFMPGVLAIVAAGYEKVPGKMDLAVELTRWTFPYLLFISLVALLSGVLNSLTRFAIAAFAPALLNIALIVALLVAPPGEIETVRYMAIAVLIGGIAQFALCWVAVRRAGVKLHFGRPRMTPAVRELVILILPATAAASGTARPPSRRTRSRSQSSSPASRRSTGATSFGSLSSTTR